MDAGLRVQQGGSGEPVLLLLHGLGATGEVWDGWRPLLGVAAVTLRGPGHNAHVESPDLSITLLDPYR
jgi:pimeloyl-ACP methyl ester carboxylesterase